MTSPDTVTRNIGIMNETKNRILGGILGAVVGDAIGVPYEFEAPREPHEVVLKGFGTHNQPSGTWSDDGSLLLCAVASLAEKGEFCPNDLSQKFLRWQKEGYMASRSKLFDIGLTTVRAFYRMRQGIAPVEAGSRLFESCGNGSLMRILPHGIFPSPILLNSRVNEIHDSSSMTHAHPLCRVSCALYALMVGELLAGSTKEDAYLNSVECLKRVYPELPERDENFRALSEVISHRPKLGSGFVLDTLHSALKAINETTNYKEAIQLAVSFGGDTDTVACVAGGLAGILYGKEAIPTEWIDSLQMEKEIQVAIEKFSQKCCDLM